MTMYCWSKERKIKQGVFFFMYNLKEENMGRNKKKRAKGEEGEEKERKKERKRKKQIRAKIKEEALLSCA